MASMALRFILENQNVGTVIPGMRKARNVNANIDCSDGVALDQLLYEELKNTVSKTHRLVSMIAQ